MVYFIVEVVIVLFPIYVGNMGRHVSTTVKAVKC